MNIAKKKSDPLRIFISGGAGTGKSHLISCIYQMALRKLQTIGDNPDDVHVLLTAPTGTAAHNISGVTLHSAFLLPLGQTKSYIKLSDDKRNALRSKASKIRLLIIDEISMVGSELLLQIHYRLCEITGINKPFGGISVLAFGDLFQLPPVMQQFVFKPSKDPLSRMYGNLWDEFSLYELTEIMRQKDDYKFAELLNRIRNATFTSEDIEVLKGRDTTIHPLEHPIDCLHVYSTNAKVDQHNTKMLSTSKEPMEILKAIDKKPHDLKNINPKNDPRFTGGLPDEITVAVGAKIMLTRNVDLSDGLVNGAQGTIKMIIKRRNSSSTISNVVALLVQFDDANTGSNARKLSRFPVENKQFSSATPIARSEISFTLSSKNKGLKMSRLQFPIKLAWACTIHKVQGITVNQIVVSFQNTFFDGQAYVALSRARTLTGLYLEHFEEKKIKANKSVLKEMDRLRGKCVTDRFFTFFKEDPTEFLISVINARSFLLHEKDILLDPCHSNSDVIVITETWLTDNIKTTSLEHFKTHNIYRVDKPGNKTCRTAGRWHSYYGKTITFQ
ncbi:ATP-dependent DNA helicase PIF1 [Mytilus galloprovincialis]|uniref:ATP-dependent DNA helicase n=1 Tax=Mytilus galloprovincialis TaxID=29158 RepID=A0A8B6HGT5_MYTGA|nr:ATP-dependent DNA helicase PIF1 [Mytilus galloprovincialis]